MAIDIVSPTPAGEGFGTLMQGLLAHKELQARQNLADQEALGKAGENFASAMMRVQERKSQEAQAEKDRESRLKETAMQVKGQKDSADADRQAANYRSELEFNAAAADRQLRERQMRLDVLRQNWAMETELERNQPTDTLLSSGPSDVPGMSVGGLSGVAGGVTGEPSGSLPSPIDPSHEPEVQGLLTYDDLNQIRQLDAEYENAVVTTTVLTDELLAALEAKKMADTAFPLQFQDLLTAAAAEEKVADYVAEATNNALPRVLSRAVTGVDLNLATIRRPSLEGENAKESSEATALGRAMFGRTTSGKSAAQIDEEAVSVTSALLQDVVREVMPTLQTANPEAQAAVENVLVGLAQVQHAASKSGKQFQRQAQILLAGMKEKVDAAVAAGVTKAELSTMVDRMAALAGPAAVADEALDIEGQGKLGKYGKYVQDDLVRMALFAKKAGIRGLKEKTASPTGMLLTIQEVVNGNASTEEEVLAMAQARMQKLGWDEDTQKAGLGAIEQYLGMQSVKEARRLKGEVKTAKGKEQEAKSKLKAKQGEAEAKGSTRAKQLRIASEARLRQRISEMRTQMQALMQEQTGPGPFIQPMGGQMGPQQPGGLLGGR